MSPASKDSQLNPKLPTLPQHWNGCQGILWATRKLLATPEVKGTFILFPHVRGIVLTQRPMVWSSSGDGMARRALKCAFQHICNTQLWRRASSKRSGGGSQREIFTKHCQDWIKIFSSQGRFCTILTWSLFLCCLHSTQSSHYCYK